MGATIAIGQRTLAGLQSVPREVAAGAGMEREARWAGLMAAAQGGDAAAYAALLRECVPLVRLVAQRQGVPPAWIDDVVQEALLAVHRARATYDPRLRFTPWLRTIAQRRAIDVLRRAGRSARHERRQGEHDPVDPAPTALQALDLADSGSRLRQAVSGLPAGQRQAVQLLGLDEMTLEEAASASGRTKVALKVNLHRALKSLRRLLVENVGG